LCHDDDERRLSQQGRFPCHIRAGDDQNLLRFAVQKYVVRYVGFVGRQLFLDDGMAPCLDVDDLRFVDFGTNIFVFLRHLCKRQQTVGTCDHIGIDLDGRNVFYQAFYQRRIELRFDNRNFIFGAQYLFFVFLQFLGDVAFGVHERLLANPIVGDFVLMRVAHFDVISEYIVKPHLE
jgi:hypothetical protein